MNAPHSMRTGAVFFAFVAVIGGCMGSLDDAWRFGSGGGADGGAVNPLAGCPDVPALLGSDTCAACHSSTSQGGGLDLVSPNVASRLVGVSARSGGLLVDTVNPDESVLLRRITGEATPKMPPSGPGFSADNVACVRAWIATMGQPATTGTPGAPGTSTPGTTTPGTPSVDAGVPIPTTTVRIAAGATAPHVDPSGATWSADTGFVGGVTAAFAGATISGTTSPELYRAERYGEAPDGAIASFSYSFNVDPGTYKVTLKFSENHFTQAGERRFSVRAQGQPLLTDFDIVQAAGGKDIAVDREFTVTVANGQPLALEFVPGAANKPKISAIAVVPASK